MKFGTVKLHFSTQKAAFAAACDGKITAGMRTASGKLKTWIAHVERVKPQETAAQAMARIKGESHV